MFALLVNLIDNAKKAMEQGGHLLIRVEMSKEGCCITVEDEGTGIPESELAKITEAFYRVDKSRSRAQGGAGLGACLVQGDRICFMGEVLYLRTVRIKEPELRWS